MFGLKNQLDEKDIYPCLHREMFGRHMSRDILYICMFTSWVFTLDVEKSQGDSRMGH